MKTSHLSIVLAAAVLMSATVEMTAAQASRAASGAQSKGTTNLDGSVKLMSRRGTRPARSVSPTDVLVLFAPRSSASARSAPNHTSSQGAATTMPAAEMLMSGKAYQPRVLPVLAGEPVQFPNRDRILHNVFSVSGDNAFDLGLYGLGKSAAHTFDEPGLVRVFCNVHRDMVGFLWVLESPHFVNPDSEGRFTLAGLPPGPGTLTVWHERAEPLELDVVIGADGKQSLSKPIELRITRPRVPSHSRKDGSAYRTRSGYTGQ